MNKNLNKIALTGLSVDKKHEDIIKSIVDILLKEEKNIFIEDNLVNSFDSLREYRSSPDQIEKNCDLLISIGGDGTIINTAKKYGIKGIPILGINFGSLGFLTDIAPDNIKKSLPSILKGEFKIDNRSFLQSKLNSSLLKQKALNEIVLHSGAVAKMIEFDVFIDGEFVYKQRADGLIVFSSTGSTAYSLSGGGPLIHPDLNIIGVMPMFPHSLNTTPIIIDQHKKVRIVLNKIDSNQNSELSFDGQENIDIKEGSSIEISKSKEEVSLIHPLDNEYFFGCRSKLGWGKSILE
ncbi:MAG: NAD(+)/NADH kinase [Pseudomonadota bacterium]|nr:NAD(+)/NADH kinase [Pseudomonadota bacterium]